MLAQIETLLMTKLIAAVEFENVKVFAAEPWWEAQPGSIKNLKINVKGN